MAGSFPLFPQRLIVSGETRKTLATSRTVNRSGMLSREIDFEAVLAIGWISDISSLLCLTIKQYHMYKKSVKR